MNRNVSGFNGMVSAHKKGVTACLITTAVMLLYLVLRICFPNLPMVPDSYRRTLWACGLICIMLFVFSYMALGIKRAPIHVITAILVLLLGGLYLWIVPIGAVPDEWTHIYTVYRYSNRVLGIDESALAANELMMRSDDAAIAIEPWDETADYHGVPLTRDKYGDYWARLGTPLSDGTLLAREVTYILPPDLFPPQQYIGPLVGVTIGRVLGMGTFDMLLLGRIASLICYTLLFTWAVYLMPDNQALLLLIALLPISLQQAMSFSYDSFTDAVAWWCFAMAMHLIYKKPEQRKIRISYYVLLGCMTLLLAFAKLKAYIGFLILLPYVLYKNGIIPKKTAKYVVSWGIAGAIILAAAVVIWRRTLTGAAPPGDFIIHNLYRLKAFYVAYIDRMGDLVTQLIGRRMGAANITPAYSTWVFFIPLIFLASIRIKDQKTEYDTLDRILFTGLFLFTTAGIFAAFYMSSPRNDETFAAGIQGRYLLPVLPPLMLALQTKKIEADRSTEAFFVPAAVALNFLMLIGIPTYMGT